MSEFWWGVVAGSAVVGLLGGPVATRLSNLLERRWDRSADRAATVNRAMATQVDRLATDPELLHAYQAQYWTWVAIVGATTFAVIAAGFLVAWSLDRSGSATAGPVAAVTALVVGGIAMFSVRKLIAKRRITRLVYRRRSDRLQ